MEYRNVNLKRLINKGKMLGNNIVLYDGIVYKQFDASPNFYLEKAYLIEKLQELNLKNLIKPEFILTKRNKPYGFAYKYAEGTILANYLSVPQKYQERLKYIESIIKTDKILLKAGYTFFDYHPFNFVVLNDIKFLDIDSILNNYIKMHEYLFNLIISIYINCDLTWSSIIPYLNILTFYFKDLPYDLEELNFEKFLEVLKKKDEEEALSLKRKIQEFNM